MMECIFKMQVNFFTEAVFSSESKLNNGGGDILLLNPCSTAQSSFSRSISIFRLKAAKSYSGCKIEVKLILPFLIRDISKSKNTSERCQVFYLPFKGIKVTPSADIAFFNITF